MVTTQLESGRGCGVDVLEAIHDRRAVRSYTRTRVEPEIVRTLIDAAIRAPSAMNCQPWAFCVIQDEALLKRISERSKELMRVRLRTEASAWSHSEMLEDPSFNVFYDGSSLIVVCAGPGIWPPNEDACLAAENLMLAAHGLGLGTCPIGFAREALNESAMKRELGIPEDHSVVMPILVGYPREQPAPTPRREPRIFSWKGAQEMRTSSSS